MELELNWQSELLLRYSVTDDNYAVDLNKISESPGIYIFGRRNRNRFEALYVGKANNIRKRIKTQLNNHKLISHIWGAKTGPRVLMIGEIITKQGQKLDSCLHLAELTLIRHFIAEGHNLVNFHGTNFKYHELLSTGKHSRNDFPKRVRLQTK